MKIKAIIEFEVEERLIREANRGGVSWTDKDFEAVEKARDDIFHQLVENLKVAETTRDYGELKKKTSLCDYKFFVVEEEPLLFEL
jgi:hypothetical protein